MRKAESEQDMANVEAWAEVVGDVLSLVPPDQHAAVLELAVKNEQALQKRREESGGLLVFSVDQLVNDSPGLLNWNIIMRLKSLVVQVFVRNITNNHSPKDAAGILFVQHRHGQGSGCLGDYIDDLPRR